jgi:regulator of replication initiation timing
MSDNTTSRAYAIIVTLLLLLSAALGWFFWQKSKTIQAEAQQNAVVADSLFQAKGQIELELDSLALAYADLRTENENLQGRISATAKTIQQKDVIIRRIKSSNTKELNELRQQVDQLVTLKTEYETIIQVLRTENDQLRNENTRLSNENLQLRTEKDQLSRQLEDQMRKTQSATFKATAFRVELQRKNDKLSTKAKKIREIDVSFDLIDVPPNYQGPSTLYMVITDEQGKPIPSDNPVRATVYAPTGPVDISAQMVKQVILESTQRLSFTYSLEDKLKSGNYVIAIYGEKGLLGATSFRLS